MVPNVNKFGDILAMPRIWPVEMGQHGDKLPRREP